MTDTVIRDIRQEIDRIHALSKSSTPRGYDYQYHLQDSACERLAALNGWWTSPYKVRPFTPADIGKRSGEYHGDRWWCLDHVRYFRAGGRCAALLTEPYEQHDENGLTITEQAQVLAEQCGVACHVPPHPRASFWYPGYAIAIVFTAPGHLMRWLPEQIEGWDDAALS
jgi:hypothetical protein